MTLRYQGRHRTPARISVPTVRTSAGISLVAAAGLMAPATAQAAPAVTAPAAPAAPNVTVPAAPTFSGLVRRGHRGTVVRTIQRKVGASADGVFGPITERSVKRYQRRHGLVADGIVGPRTGAKMGLSRSSGAASRSTARTTLRSTSGSGVIGTAASLVGSPYRYGGTSPSGFDCSGFTQYVFARNGVSLPRTAEQQRQATTRVSSPQVGDLVFFGAPAYHVGIYAGNGQIYDAGRSGSTVTKRSIWTNAVTYGRA